MWRWWWGGCGQRQDFGLLKAAAVILPLLKSGQHLNKNTLVKYNTIHKTYSRRYYIPYHYFL